MIIRECIQGIRYVIYLPRIYKASLWWLHGYKEDIEHIVEKSDLFFYAEKKQMAVFLPEIATGTYYTDYPWKSFGESVLYLQEKYQLPKGSKKNFLGGNSMGAFGSMLIGSHYPDVFGKIVSISGAFIIDDVLIGNPEVVASNNEEHFEKLFGDFFTLEESIERNPLRAAEQAIQKGEHSPIFMTCGREDMLYPRNLKMYQKLEEAGAEVMWVPQKCGTHSWQFVNSVLEEVFQWLED